MASMTHVSAAAKALAAQLDAYLNGDRTQRRVSQIEGALSDAEPLEESMEWFEDLVYAAAVFEPTGGPEYMNEDEFGRVAQMARNRVVATM